jgi:hypothetical protein
MKLHYPLLTPLVVSDAGAILRAGQLAGYATPAKALC